jgi:hypothetical protein
MGSHKSPCTSSSGLSALYLPYLGKGAPERTSRCLEGGVNRLICNTGVRILRIYVRIIRI